MSKDTSTTGRWLKRLTQSLSGEPQDRGELLTLLRETAERGLVDADALEMLEGVLAVADLQVRDIMVPRIQMVSVRRDDPPARILPIVIESGHSRFPVMDADRDDIVGILLAKDLLRHFAAGRMYSRISKPARGGVRSGVEAAQRAAEGISPQS